MAHRSLFKPVSRNEQRKASDARLRRGNTFGDAASSRAGRQAVYAFKKDFELSAKHPAIYEEFELIGDDVNISQISSRSTSEIEQSQHLALLHNLLDVDEYLEMDLESLLQYCTPKQFHNLQLPEPENARAPTLRPPTSPLNSSYRPNTYLPPPSDAVETWKVATQNTAPKPEFPLPRLRTVPTSSRKACGKELLDQDECNFRPSHKESSTALAPGIHSLNPLQKTLEKPGHSKVTSIEAARHPGKEKSSEYRDSAVRRWLSFIPVSNRFG